jgi:replication-associated recombination protein RarA
MKEAGYGKDHVRYPWRDGDSKQEYLPKNLNGKKYYVRDWK